jgi:asparagine synthase (glutamine-hydrolysing)
MCGIAGLLGGLDSNNEDVLRSMARAIAHRGPDDEGVWLDREAGVGLAHRRLSIVDLSPLGHQPMLSSDGRYVIVFNGEIYNHVDLRTELGASGRHSGAWRGHSDTETLIEAIAAWGLQATLERCVGMFALALWDKRARSLSLARDRFGEKPLYYGWIGRDFVFGSELKALRQHPGFDNPINRRALQLFAARTYVPAPLSIYERIYKLEPACILTLDEEGARKPLSEPPSAGGSDRALRMEPYWSYRDVVRRGHDDPIADEREALDRLEHALAEAVRGQSVADVPVGAFLSGGIDSSTVVALYQKYSSDPVRTFSIGFEEAGFDEAAHAKAVAAHLGTVHAERYVTVKEAREVIPLLPDMYDEPFADSSQIPTHLVSRFAREQVKVAISGDGGDELFAGYNRHFAAPQMWQRLEMLPRAVRPMIALPLSRVPLPVWNLARGRRPAHFGAKLQKAMRVAASARSFEDVCTSFLDEWSLQRSPIIGGDARDVSRLDLDLGPGVPDSIRIMYWDAVSYLPDDILCKVDRASMAVSLETRVPFLDHRVAELAARIPLSMKVRGGKGKHIVRELLYREAPRRLFERPKAGFAVPVGEWLKGPLRHWAEDLLDPKELTQDGFFDPQVVISRWREHLTGRQDATPALWSVLMFQAWKRKNNASEAKNAEI